MMRKIYIILLSIFISNFLFCGLFDSAIDADNSSDNKLNYELNGYIRSDIYIGKNSNINSYEIKSEYGELSLKMKVDKGTYGNAYAEFRSRLGNEFSETVTENFIREAYINLFLGRFDIRLGQQIVVWGRADGFNPTDNITPKNMFVRSVDEDDRRLSNFLVRTYYNLNPLRLELIWLPIFKPSYTPISYIAFPNNISINQGENPAVSLENSAYAIRINLLKPGYEGSISYFNGYNTYPGLDLASVNLPSLSLDLKLYRYHIFGADFSTTIGSFGLRSEMAYRYPEKSYEANLYIPNPDFQYILGTDRTIGDFNFILQYIGKTIFDYKDVETIFPNNMVNQTVEEKNRMISSQQYRISHSISYRIGLNFLHETLTCESFGLYNFSSQEFMTKTQAKYSITDACLFTTGIEYYYGSENTIFNQMDTVLGGVYAELKISY